MWRKLKQFDIESIAIEPKEIKKKIFLWTLIYINFIYFSLSIQTT